MKTFKVKHGNRTFKVFADSGVEAIEKVRAVADAGWFNNTTVTVKSANDVSLSLIVSTVKRVAGRFVKKIMNGKLRDMTLILQVYVKDNMTGRFNWMELPITFMLDFNAANKVRAQNEDYGVKKLLSEIIQKIKTFENRTIYEDKALVADSAVADAIDVKHYAKYGWNFADDRFAYDIFNEALEKCAGKFTTKEQFVAEMKKMMTSLALAYAKSGAAEFDKLLSIGIANVNNVIKTELNVDMKLNWDNVLRK